jgi:hypothetical protein
MTKKNNSPVMFDANILLGFKGQMKYLFSFFEKIIIHKTVYDEVISDDIKDEINSLTSEGRNIQIVSKYKPQDVIDEEYHKLLSTELEKSFNIHDKRDLGEYESLIYAKFNKVYLFSTQDTTVWYVTKNSQIFSDIECITIQDIAYLIFLDKNKKNARNLYRRTSNNDSYPWQWFKKYAENNEEHFPTYNAFENNRTLNFQDMVSSYVEVLEETSRRIIKIIVDESQKRDSNCQKCIYSRRNPQSLNISERVCYFQCFFCCFFEVCTLKRNPLIENSSACNVC